MGMAEGTPSLYRGTTRGWMGNPVLRNVKMTCTSTDPLVATLCAVECRSRGKAIIQVARREGFKELVGPPNHAADVECAVNVLVEPTSFMEHVFKEIEADEALAVLADMGFAELPHRINGYAALGEALRESHNRSQRLSVEQIHEFDRRVVEAFP